jgi:hypothetical protein
MAKKNIIDTLKAIASQFTTDKIVFSDGSELDVRIYKPTQEFMDKYSKQMQGEDSQRKPVNELIVECLRNEDGSSIVENIEDLNKISFEDYTILQRYIIDKVIQRKSLTEFEVKNSQGSPSSDQQ